MWPAIYTNNSDKPYRELNSKMKLVFQPLPSNELLTYEFAPLQYEEENSDGGSNQSASLQHYAANNQDLDYIAFDSIQASNSRSPGKQAVQRRKGPDREDALSTINLLKLLNTKYPGMRKQTIVQLLNGYRHRHFSRSWLSQQLRHLGCSQLFIDDLVNQ